MRKDETSERKYGHFRPKQRVIRIWMSKSTIETKHKEEEKLRVKINQTYSQNLDKYEFIGCIH